MTPRLELRLANANDARDLVAYDRRNTEHLRTWEPTRDAASVFDEPARAATLAIGLTEAMAGRMYRFVARKRAGEGDIVAVVTLSNVVRGSFSRATSVTRSTKRIRARASRAKRSGPSSRSHSRISDCIA